MDNARIHHHLPEEVLDRWMVDHRTFLLYLPPYSPELNLIEIVWRSSSTIGDASSPGRASPSIRNSANCSTDMVVSFKSVSRSYLINFFDPVAIEMASRRLLRTCS
jgi:hypothetical protein